MTTPATTPVSTPTPPPKATTPVSTPTPPVRTVEYEEKQRDLSVADLLFALTCYCYIYSSHLGYEAINSLNPNLVVLLTNFVQATAEQGAETASLSTELAQGKKEAIENASWSNSKTGESIQPPDQDELDETA